MFRNLTLAAMAALSLSACQTTGMGPALGGALGAAIGANQCDENRNLCAAVGAGLGAYAGHYVENAYGQQQRLPQEVHADGRQCTLMAGHQSGYHCSDGSFVYYNNRSWYGHRTLSNGQRIQVDSGLLTFFQRLTGERYY